MRNRELLIASAGTILGLSYVATRAYERLPAGTLLPVHWGVTGEPDRMADASLALALPVLLCVLFSGLLFAVPKLEPLQPGLDRSVSLLRTTWASLLGLMALIELCVAAPAFGLSLPTGLPIVGVGLLLVAIGNALPKSRPGFFIGIRTPWALIDEDNWIATHRLGSRTMMAAGGMIVLGTLLPLPPTTRALLFWLAIATVVVPPVLYSYLHWRRAQVSS
ncbi:SdpI family protein [Sphingomonas sp. Mn802worker]|uniref:SdpI family protein n=1 Tax=Sphingomonas sp. Mn802worker TaxID=629773 RepID=UPI0003AB0002|nr:SdpI family protein [Sphingomonas sp. Mn802worker]